MLKNVWNIADCVSTLANIVSNQTSIGDQMIIGRKTTIPIVLNSKWIAVARFAFAFVPIEAITDVIHEPMFMPSVAYIIDFKGIPKEPAKAIKIPEVADEL